MAGLTRVSFITHEETRVAMTPVPVTAVPDSRVGISTVGATGGTRVSALPDLSTNRGETLLACARTRRDPCACRSPLATSTQPYSR